MTVTSASTGVKATFAIGDGTDGGSSEYTKVGEVISITAPGVTREAIDVTHLESPDGFREFIPGLMDMDAATIQFNYVPAATDALYTAMQTGKGDFEITYPNGVKFRFKGIVQSWKPGDVSTTTMTGEFTVKPTGKPTLVGATTSSKKSEEVSDSN